jgi:hypothetical protein
LDPKRPGDYRDYAEELAEKRRDPDALDMSLRLYLIAAYLAPERLGRSSLLGMAALARNSEEEARFRAMAFLLDPDRDVGLLKQSEAEARSTQVPDEKARILALKVVQAMRRGERRTARTRAKSLQVRAVLDFYADLITYDEFMEVQEPVPPQMLHRLLKLELLLSADHEDAAQDGAQSPSAWSQVVSRDGTAPIRGLSLQTLTEFNPRECVYRDGVWKTGAPDPIHR